MIRHCFKKPDGKEWSIRNYIKERVYEPLQTGLIAIDSMIPIGRGQREWDIFTL